MLLDLQPNQLITILGSEDLLRAQVEEAADMLFTAGFTVGDGTTESSSGRLQHMRSGITRAASSPNLPGKTTRHSGL